MGCDPPISSRRPWPTYFNPRIPYGMRLDTNYQVRSVVEFQSTHPVWDATVADRQIRPTRLISIHASRMGCDFLTGLITAPSTEFQSTHPVWDATLAIRMQTVRRKFQSTHPVWDATILTLTAWFIDEVFQSTHPVWDATHSLPSTNRWCKISIHASRMGCDAASTCPAADSAKISIHASRMGCDVRTGHHNVNTSRFQSTHPVWDAT